MRPTRKMTGRRWHQVRHRRRRRADARRCQRLQQQLVVEQRQLRVVVGVGVGIGVAGGGGDQLPAERDALHQRHRVRGRRSNWNPLDTGNFATGTQGLIYEPLFLYDPIKGTYDPWLARAT